MFQRTKLCTGLLAAFGGSMMLAALPSVAQETQRVEITGSSIKRIDAESSLPVQVIKREQIERSGATSTVDLIQRLAVIQGATQESSSVGGNTYGFSGVSIHDIGETRTLVLLNGHRLAQFGGQTLTGFAAGFDLNAIPISAIERVEVLTDGASALYGADAIAGVVNFITKRDSTEGNITVGFSSPKGGAVEKRISATKGFGSLATDGYNFVFSVAHDQRTALKAADRDFASTGNLVFSKGGKTYRSQNYSASAIPANVVDDNGNLINPYLIANGACPANTFRVTDGGDDFCGFDFVSTLEIYPERKRDSFMGGATYQLGDHQLYADLLLSRTKQVSKIAPVPGGLSITAGSDLFNTYLAPLGITQDTVAFYRVYDLGPRASSDEAKFFDLSLGSRGTLGTWDYDANLTHSQSDVKGNISGYPGALALAKLRASGALNPFVLPGNQSEAGQAALAAANYKGYWDGGTSKLTTFALHGSTPVGKLEGGDVMLGLGMNYQNEKFQSKPSLFAQAKLTDPVTGELCDANDPTKPCDQRFGDAAAAVPYGANRNSWGAFGELIFPLAKSLEVSTAFRFDKFSDFGNAHTAKGAFRWTPISSLLIRGSIGTGYHAPSVPQLKASPQSYGVTNDPYECTDELAAIAASLGGVCRPGSQQYDVVAGGNADLKPERSKQATLGFRIEPSQAVSIGLDYWWVGIRDAFGQLSEATLFESPSKYPGAWTTQTDIGTGVTYLALNQGNLNLGKEFRSGVDLDVSSKVNTGLGPLTTQLNASYVIKSALQDPVDKSYSSAVGQYNSTVTFRWQGRLSTSLKAGDWTHTLGMNFKSGFRDEPTDVEVLDSAGLVTGVETVQLDIKPQYTFDWQTEWAFRKDMVLTVGVLNLGDKKPPFVISAGGGQQVGYDDRYYDPRGRTFYANFQYKF